MSGDIQTINPGLASGSSGNLTSLNVSGVATLTSGATFPKTDTSGTPGNATINTPGGRCAIAAAATAVTISSTLVTAASKVVAYLSGAAADATLTSLLRVNCGAGTFTITGNAAATAAVQVDFVVFP